MMEKLPGATRFITNLELIALEAHSAGKASPEQQMLIAGCVYRLISALVSNREWLWQLKQYLEDLD